MCDELPDADSCSSQNRVLPPDFLPRVFTREFAEEIYQIQKSTKNYRATLSLLKRKYPFMCLVKLSDFQDACQKCFPYLKGKPPSQSLLDTFSQSMAIESNSNCYYYKQLPPNEEARLGRWSQEEEVHFIKCLQSILAEKPDLVNPENKHASWGYISLSIKGRTGKQCYDKYVSLARA